MFTAYLTAHSSKTSPLAPPKTERITVVKQRTGSGPSDGARARVQRMSAWLEWTVPKGGISRGRIYRPSALEEFAKKQVQRVLTVAAVAALLGLGATPAEASVNINALGGAIVVDGDGATTLGVLGQEITLPVSLDGAL